MLYTLFIVCVYLLHALQSLLQEAELLLAGGVLLAALGLRFTLLLFQKLHLVPVGVQLTSQTVVLLFQSLHLSQRPWESRESWRDEKRPALVTGKGRRATHERRVAGVKNSNVTEARVQSNIHGVRPGTGEKKKTAFLKSCLENSADGLR